MKNRNILLAVGIFIGSFLLIQVIPTQPKLTVATPDINKNIELTSQKNAMVSTAVYYVLSFIKHN